VRAGAVDKAKLHLRSFRESLVKGAAGRPANELIEEALKDLFSADLPWATTIETYVGSLNGETAFFADRLCKEAAEWPPSNPMPGRDRHRKFFVLATGGANSAACKALKERLPGAVGVVGLEHIGDDLLVVAEERNVVLAELPEACACIDAFRALPAEKQALLVTAVEDASHVIDYRPDSAEDRDRPGRLLACALALGIVTRLSSQDYRFGSQLFAKGFRAAVVALALDQRLAGFLAAKVEEAVSRDGSAAVATKLKSAHEQPSLFVPKDAAGEFQGALEAATCELDRRAVAASRVQ
jgi:hypothetical protein